MPYSWNADQTCNLTDYPHLEWVSTLLLRLGNPVPEQNVAFSVLSLFGAQEEEQRAPHALKSMYH